MANGPARQLLLRELEQANARLWETARLVLGPTIHGDIVELYPRVLERIEELKESSDQ